MISTRMFAVVCAGLLFVSNPVVSEPTADGEDQLLLAQAQQRQMVREKTANPFNFEYVSGSLGGRRSRFEPDALYYGDAIKISVVNAGTSDGVAQIDIYATERDTNTVVKRSGVSTIRPGLVLFLEYLIPSSAERILADFYWVRIRTSNEFLIPRAKSVKLMPEGQWHPVRTIADYAPGDFAVFSTDPYKRIW